VQPHEEVSCSWLKSHSLQASATPLTSTQDACSASVPLEMSGKFRKERKRYRGWKSLCFQLNDNSFLKKNKGSIRDSVKASDQSNVKISCFNRCKLFLSVHVVTVPSSFYKSFVSNGDTRTRSFSSCNLLWYELNLKVQPVMCTQNKVLTNRREYYVTSLNRQCRFSKPPQFTDMFTRNT